jgi:hypothetical protein
MPVLLRDELLNSSSPVNGAFCKPNSNEFTERTDEYELQNQDQSYLSFTHILHLVSVYVS